MTCHRRSYVIRQSKDLVASRLAHRDICNIIFTCLRTFIRLLFHFGRFLEGSEASFPTRLIITLISVFFSEWQLSPDLYYLTSISSKAARAAPLSPFWFRKVYHLRIGGKSGGEYVSVLSFTIGVAMHLPLNSSPPWIATSGLYFDDLMHEAIVGR